MLLQQDLQSFTIKKLEVQTTNQPNLGMKEN